MRGRRFSEGPNRHDRNLLAAIGATMAMILYGSLYPFAFHAPPPGGAGALVTLLGTWSKTPGRGDFASNILLYTPLGFFGGILARLHASLKRIALIVLLGATLSFSIELLQYYDTGRDTEATDFYANVAGTILGALFGRSVGRNIRWSVLSGVPANPVPALLLVAWLGYRLYPYVPTIDLHKYWNAIKPLVLHPSATPYAIFRQTAFWMAICLLVEKIANGRRAVLLFGIFAGLVTGASILIVTTWLNLSQLIGMGIAFCLWRLTAEQSKYRITIAAGLVGVNVLALRLEPFEFSAEPGKFGLVPFLGFMQGSIDIDVQSFCEKFFLYGVLIWLLRRTGLRMAFTVILVASALFITSLAEIFIPGRSAEITDAAMALGIAGVIALLDADAGAERELEFANRDRQDYRKAYTKTADTLTGRLTEADSFHRANNGDPPPCPPPPLA